MFLFRSKKEDRRKYTRLKAHHLLKYKILKRAEPSNPSSFIRDISAGGAALFSEEYIPLESIIEITVKLPIFKEPVPIICRVVRVKHLMDGYEVGVEFMDLNPQLKEALDSRIKDAYKKRGLKRKGS